MLPFDRIMGGTDSVFANGAPFGMDIIDEESSGSEEEPEEEMLDEEEIAELPELHHAQSELNTLRPPRTYPSPFSNDHLLEKLNGKLVKEEEEKSP